MRPVGRVSRRYGGMTVDDGFRLDAPYYLVTQVRGVAGTRPEHRRCLRALRLGQIGKCHVVRNTPADLGPVIKVRHLVVVEPWDGPDEASDSGRLAIPSARGNHARVQLDPEVDVAWDPQAEEERQEEGGRTVKTLKDAIKGLHHLLRPDLEEEQLDAIADLNLNEIDPTSGKALDDEARERLAEKVRQVVEQPPTHAKSR
jgi:large subunit ribosomal protein L30